MEYESEENTTTNDFYVLPSDRSKGEPMLLQEADEEPKTAPEVDHLPIKEESIKSPKKLDLTEFLQARTDKQLHKSTFIPSNQPSESRKSEWEQPSDGQPQYDPKPKKIHLPKKPAVTLTTQQLRHQIEESN
jgi:hypothetical protein